MKKFLILLSILQITVLPSFSANWFKLLPKTYLDLDSFKKINLIGISNPPDIREAWIKDLNPGWWDLLDNKRIWYKLNYLIVDCTNDAYYHQTNYFYDLNSKLLGELEGDNNINILYKYKIFKKTVPETHQSLINSLMCSFTPKNEHSVKINFYY